MLLIHNLHIKEGSPSIHETRFPEEPKRNKDNEVHRCQKLFCPVIEM